MKYIQKNQALELTVKLEGRMRALRCLYGTRAEFDLFISKGNHDLLLRQYPDFMKQFKEINVIEKSRVTTVEFSGTHSETGRFGFNYV